ncbi:MAG: hypothetical protein D3905_12590 [Candidatus Electrothrix sp. AS4_5]|nr:hypothetical protein [Candidatus Electrothrix gigas]
MKPFSKWTKEEIEDEFSLIADRQHGLLQEWLAVSPSFSDAEQQTLCDLSQTLLTHVHDWNEEELKVYFIASLLNMVNFYQPSYRPFLERELSVEYADGKRLWGIADFLVASGRQAPKQPFFFLHEYKKELDSSNDPLGQLLAEMVAAQTANAHAQPVYGAYIIGRHWYFVLLDGKVYAESLAYDATKEAELVQITAVLRKTKEIIDELICSGTQTVQFRKN